VCNIKSVDFSKNIKTLDDFLGNCNLCPRACGINRKKKEKGYCKTTDEVYIASHNLHFGEEPPITGTNGSGTIFFSFCNLGCEYCQNYPISHLGNGKLFTIEELVDMMLKLQNKGAHNINFVSPTHYSAQMAKAVYLAKTKGLKIPIVYNCSGYEPVEIIELLDGVVDIYLVDMKYGINDLAKKYSNIENYVEINKLAVAKMFQQVGYLKLNENGIAQKGIIVRHLMLPKNIENTFNVLDALSEISSEIHLSFMSQYHPAHNSYKYPDLSKKLTKTDYKKGIKYLEKKCFNNGWIQEF
jgi:putative pyruvate formate lyase activating enzyme